MCKKKTGRLLKFYGSKKFLRIFVFNESILHKIMNKIPIGETRKNCVIKIHVKHKEISRDWVHSMQLDLLKFKEVFPEVQ